MVTEEVNEIMKRYPPVAEIVELAAHYEGNNPFLRICEYLVKFAGDVFPVQPVQPEPEPEPEPE
jgi:hypothetical protein